MNLTHICNKHEADSYGTMELIMNDVMSRSPHRKVVRAADWRTVRLQGTLCVGKPTCPLPFYCENGRCTV